jgi:hypothetical protein
LRFASLGSGSEGNALLVEAGGALPGGIAFRVLVDCGFGLREAERRLARLGCPAASIAGILVTHEHGDHVGGVFRLARAHRIPVYLTHGTLRATPQAAGCEDLVNVVDSHRPFELAGLRVEPFPVPHDAREPVQYVLDDGAARLGVLTDIGHPTAYLPQALSRLTALVLETNHDAALRPRSSAGSRGATGTSRTPIQRASSPRSTAAACAGWWRPTSAGRTTGPNWRVPRSQACSAGRRRRSGWLTRTTGLAGSRADSDRKSYSSRPGPASGRRGARQRSGGRTGV